MTTKDEHFLQHGLIAVFTIATLAIFGMVMLISQATERQILLPGAVENTAGLATAPSCSIDRACFNSCAQTLASRTDISVTESCTQECCIGGTRGGALVSNEGNLVGQPILMQCASVNEYGHCVRYVKVYR